VLASELVSELVLASVLRRVLVPVREIQYLLHEAKKAE